MFLSCPLKSVFVIQILRNVIVVHSGENSSAGCSCKYSGVDGKFCGRLVIDFDELGFTISHARDEA